MRKRRSRTLYAVDADDKGRDDDTDLAVEKDAVGIQTIQELRLEPQRSNDPCIKELSLEV